MAQAEGGLRRMKDLLTAAVGSIGIPPNKIAVRNGGLFIDSAGLLVQPSAVTSGAWSVIERYEVSDIGGGPMRFVSQTLVAATDAPAAARLAALTIAERRIDAGIDAHC